MKRTAATLSLLTAVTWALAACGSPAEDVASVASPAGAADAADADLMPEFVDCLVAAGIPAGLGTDGRLSFDENSQVTVTSDPDGESTVEIDGEDVTESWNACKAEVPGVEPFAEHDDLDVSALNEAGTEWATCARENGFPTMPDPVDGTIALPADLTPETVTTLAEACPAFTDEESSFGFTVPDSWSGEYTQSILDALFGPSSMSTIGGDE